MVSLEMDRLFQWKGYALCRQFFFAHFGSLSSPGSAGDAGSNVHFHVVWAVGGLADGQRELLGVWPRLPDDRATWSYVLADLWMRGVERIEQVVTLGLVAAEPGSLVSRPRIDRWCGADTLRSLPLVGSARRRVQLTSATSLAEQAQAYILRSTRRQGLFETEDAAIAFVTGRLERIEWGRGMARQNAVFPDSRDDATLENRS